MYEITRQRAIQTIYTAARARGWDSEQLHGMLRDWGYGSDPHLSWMSPVQLSEVLRCFRISRFVLDDKSAYYLRRLAKDMGRVSLLAGWMMNRFGHDNVYRLSPAEKRAGIAMMKNYRRNG